jgi:hypothetical protein
LFSFLSEKFVKHTMPMAMHGNRQEGGRVRVKAELWENIEEAGDA